jgi:hypothetical protein
MFGRLIVFAPFLIIIIIMIIMYYEYMTTQYFVRFVLSI